MANKKLTKRITSKPTQSLHREYKDPFGVSVKGHVKITDDQGVTHLDKENAIHPQNMARVIARALSLESNYWIHRLALGNGGTTMNAAYQITYKTPRDGISDELGHASRLYNETYSEFVSSDNTSNDGNTVVSTEVGTISQVTITVTLGPDQPSGQPITDNLSPVEYTDNLFTFDELGLYTSGLAPTAVNGYQEINVGDNLANDITGLAPNGVQYGFWVRVDGETSAEDIEIVINTPNVGDVTFQHIIDAINGSTTAIRASMSGDIAGSNTYGAFRITSNHVPVGSDSSIYIYPFGTGPAFSDLATQPLLESISDFVDYYDPIPGSDAGLQNNAVAPQTEVERLLTHLIFSPITKTANRTYTITYILTIQVSPTAE